MQRYFEDGENVSSGPDLDSDSSKFIESLSGPVRQRVAALHSIQTEQDEVTAKFEEAVRKLKKQFLEESYQALFERRFAIINGLIDPSDGRRSSPAGVADFWLRALRNHADVAMTISERDEDALKHLTDIRLDYLGDGSTGDFRLSFYFRPNPYFTNEVLRKKYIYKVDNLTNLVQPSHIEVDHINWNPGNDLSIKVTSKNVEDKGTQVVRVVQETVAADTFFEFFNPVGPTTEFEDKEDNDTNRWLLDLEFGAGEQFRDEIIPEAVRWFTGEAAEEEREEEPVDEEDYGKYGKGQDGYNEIETS